MTRRTTKLLAMAIMAGLTALGPSRAMAGPTGADSSARAGAPGPIHAGPPAHPDTSSRARHGASPHASPHATGMPGGGSMAQPAHKPFRVVLPPGLPKVNTVTLEIRHRVFQDFLEARQVPLHTRFQIGDTDYDATVTDFVPDFSINIKTRRITTISKEPVRPAVRVVVREKGVTRDTTWAFLDNPPHFAPRSLLSFSLLRVDFVDHAPVARDTTKAAGAKP